MAKSKWPQVKAAIDDGRILAWFKTGMFEKTVAKNLGIAVGTWEKYKTQHAELREVIKEGNRSVVQMVEDALIRKACGFHYEETKSYERELANGETVTNVEHVRKYCPPDTGAAIFILKNKDREHWKNDPAISELRKREIELRERIAEGRGELWD